MAAWGYEFYLRVLKVSLTLLTVGFLVLSERQRCVWWFYGGGDFTSCM